MKENLKVVGFVVAVVLALVAFSLGTRWVADNIPQSDPYLVETEESCAAITPTSTITPTPTSTPAPTFAPDLETSAAVVEQGVEALFTVDSRCDDLRRLKAAASQATHDETTHVTA